MASIDGQLLSVGTIFDRFCWACQYSSRHSAASEVRPRTTQRELVPCSETRPIEPPGWYVRWAVAHGARIEDRGRRDRQGPRARNGRHWFRDRIGGDFGYWFLWLDRSQSHVRLRRRRRPPRQRDRYPRLRRSPHHPRLYRRLRHRPQPSQALHRRALRSRPMTSSATTGHRATSVARGSRARQPRGSWSERVRWSTMPAGSG